MEWCNRKKGNGNAKFWFCWQFFFFFIKYVRAGSFYRNGTVQSSFIIFGLKNYNFKCNGTLTFTIETEYIEFNLFYNIQNFPSLNIAYLPVIRLTLECF